MELYSIFTGNYPTRVHNLQSLGHIKEKIVSALQGRLKLLTDKIGDLKLASSTQVRNPQSQCEKEVEKITQKLKEEVY